MNNKKQNIYKDTLPYESEFDHHYACWAINHNGWAKMKKFNKKIAKRRERQKLNKELKDYDT